MRQIRVVLGVVGLTVAVAALGCQASLPPGPPWEQARLSLRGLPPPSEEREDEKANGEHQPGPAKEGPKKLLEWAAGKAREKEGKKGPEDSESKSNTNGRKEDNDKGRAAEADKRGTDDKKETNGGKEAGQETQSKKGNAKGEKSNGEAEGGPGGKRDGAREHDRKGGQEEEDEITTDRPDFTESSTTVGKGRVQLESGYTFVHDRSRGSTVNSHSFPEALLRVGMFADWFELRLGQNFGAERESSPGGVAETRGGAFDLYLGVKLALTEQQGWLPEMALTVQATVPSGSDAFSADEFLPGLNWLYGWDVIKDCLSVGGSTQANRIRGVHLIPVPGGPEGLPEDGVQEVKHSYLLLAQSLTVGYTLTKKLGAYTEWFALIPHSSLDPEVGPEHYLNGGFTYKVTKDVQLDIRAGFGLNSHADDFFAGSGFAVRY